MTFACNFAQRDLSCVFRVQYGKYSNLIANFLEEITGYEYSTEEQLLSNEWVNKIGNDYVLVCEI